MPTPQHSLESERKYDSKIPIFRKSVIHKFKIDTGEWKPNQGYLFKNILQRTKFSMFQNNPTGPDRTTNELIHIK